MNFTARILFSFFLLFVFLFFKPSFVNAQTVQPRPDLHNYTQNVMIETLSSMACLIAGVDVVNPSQKCLGIENGKIGPVDAKGGALGVVGNLIAMTYNPPFHTGDYVSYLAGGFGIAKPAHAQGIGFTGLRPLIEIWTAFRNIAYLLFVLVFTVIGFAIMLRVHIDPRTVMTIENQIPKIVIGLLLVTFSFAIAGLMIDLMWVLTYLSISVFDTIHKTALGTGISPGLSNIQGISALSIANEIDGGILGITNNASQGVGGFIAGLLQGPPGNFIGAILFGALGAGVGIIVPGIGNLVGALVGGAIGGLVGGVGANNALGFLGQIIAFLIIALAILFALFRLWFSLIKSYVMILIITVFSPFWVLGGLIPGSKITFGNFIRALASNLLVFPATIIMFLLAKTFMDIFEGPGAGSTFVPPLIGNPGDYKAIGALIGLGIILLTPDVTKIMGKVFQAPEFDLGAIGASIGVGAGAVNPLALAGRAGQFGTTLYYASMTPVLGGLLERMGYKRPGGGGTPH